MKSLYSILVLSIILASCGTSNSVTSNHFLQKRKYTSGWHFNNQQREIFSNTESIKENINTEVSLNSTIEYDKSTKPLIELERIQKVNYVDSFKSETPNLEKRIKISRNDLKENLLNTPSNLPNNKKSIVSNESESDSKNIQKTAGVLAVLFIILSLVTLVVGGLISAIDSIGYIYTGALAISPVLFFSMIFFFSFIICMAIFIISKSKNADISNIKEENGNTPIVEKEQSKKTVIDQKIEVPIKTTPEDIAVAKKNKKIKTIALLSFLGLAILAGILILP